MASESQVELRSLRSMTFDTHHDTRLSGPFRARPSMQVYTKSSGIDDVVAAICFSGNETGVGNVEECYHATEKSGAVF